MTAWWPKKSAGGQSDRKGTLQVKVQILDPDHFLTPELSAKVDFLKKSDSGTGVPPVPHLEFDLDTENHALVPQSVDGSAPRSDAVPGRSGGTPSPIF